MKKSLLSTMLGLAASAMTSFGQGYISFDNYVTFGGAGAPIWILNVGTPVPVGATVQLYYQLGTAANPALTGTLLGTTTIGSGGTGAGYYNGGNVTVLNYVSGDISFQVYAESLFGGSAVFAYSSTLVLPSIATGLTPPTELDIPSFTLHYLPEPSTFALGSLGFGALLFFRRRKT